MKLNLGCGDDRRDGYVNVDLRSEVADVCCDVRDLPFEDDSVEEILALDILEHLPPDSTMPALREWRRVLAPGGTLTVKVPNLYALALHIVEDRSPAMMIRNVYGGHRWGQDGELDCHHVGFTPEMLHATLVEAGFHFVQADRELNMTVTAKKV